MANVAMGVEALALALPSSCSYSPPMSDKLDALLERLKAYRRTFIPVMAENGGATCAEHFDM
jgi:hypothetical protein